MIEIMPMLYVNLKKKDKSGLLEYIVNGKLATGLKIICDLFQQAYQMLNVNDCRLFCVGNYPEILVYDPHTLDILFSLAARIQPDWISALHILRPPRRNGKSMCFTIDRFSFSTSTSSFDPFLNLYLILLRDISSCYNLKTIKTTSGL